MPEAKFLLLVVVVAALAAATATGVYDAYFAFLK
jgi:hypothetical protein